MQVHRIKPVERTDKQCSLQFGNTTDAIVGKRTVVFGINSNRFTIYIELKQSVVSSSAPNLPFGILKNSRNIIAGQNTQFIFSIGSEVLQQLHVHITDKNPFVPRADQYLSFGGFINIGNEFLSDQPVQLNHLKHLHIIDIQEHSFVRAHPQAVAGVDQ